MSATLARTLTADCLRSSTQRSPADSAHLVRSYEAYCQLYRLARGKDQSGPIKREHNDNDESALLNAAWPFEAAMLEIQKGRQFCFTAAGYTCLAPHDTAPGDLLVVFPGFCMPFVLRLQRSPNTNTNNDQEEGEGEGGREGEGGGVGGGGEGKLTIVGDAGEGGRKQFGVSGKLLVVGDAYVHGLMDSEMVHPVSAAEDATTAAQHIATDKFGAKYIFSLPGRPRLLTLNDLIIF